MALIPPFLLNTIVAIGTMNGNDFTCNATGFMYGVASGEQNSSGQQLYTTFLVTNRHVISESAGSLMARYNLSSGPASTPQPLESGWTVHPSGSDVAVTPVDSTFIMSENVDYRLFTNDQAMLNRQGAIEAGLSEGNGVFVLGFPLQLMGKERNYVIVRQGIIARIQDWLKGEEDKFLIDASIFPGNSGGPVVTRPEVVRITDTLAYNRCSLIGMVSAYIPYQEVAVSTQTKRPRMIFEENSGLGEVVPVDAIEETIKLALNKRSQRRS